MQTHTAGLNITPAGTCLAVLCYVSNNYKSLPLKLSALQMNPFLLLYWLQPFFRLFSTHAVSALSTFSLFHTPIEVSIWLLCALYSCQGRDCTGQQLPSLLILYAKTHTSPVCVWCVCVRMCGGQRGSVCPAACHLLGQWAHWSPGSCRCVLVSVWQVINRARPWTPTLLAALPTVLQSWTHIPFQGLNCVYCVCVCAGKCTNVYYFPGALTHNCFTLCQNRGTHTNRREGTIVLFTPLIALFFSRFLCFC